MAGISPHRGMRWISFDPGPGRRTLRAMNLTASTTLVVPSISATRRRWPGLVLSLLLHGLVALAWMGFPLPRLDEDRPEPVLNVDLVPQPPPQAPSPASPPPVAPPQPPPQPQRSAPPPPPQLQPGELAEKSTPPVPDRAEPKAPKEGGPGIAASPAPRQKRPVTQSERDYVLSKVLAHWHMPAALAAFAQAETRINVRVMADGHFADIYDSRRPWNPAEVFDGYAGLAPQAVQRQVIDALYKAIRAAQPLALPETLKAKAPFDLRLDFRFRDVR